MASVLEESESHQNQSIEDLLKSLCDFFCFDSINKRLQEILLRLVVATPEKKTLSKDSPTYLHRLRLTQTFLNERKKRSQKIEAKEGFSKDLEKYIADKQGSCEDQDFVEERQACRRVSWLEEGCTGVVNGIVLRRSPKFVAVYVANPNVESKPVVADEFVAPIPNDFPGFGVVLKIGDVLTVRLTSGVKGIEVVLVSLESCYSLSKNETEDFLVKAVNVLETEGAPEVLAALTSTSSCFAVWSHLVQERCKKDKQITEKLLTLCCDVMAGCSMHSFQTRFEKFLEPFVDSAFLTDTLKRFITDGDKNREKVQMVKKFLGHVIKYHPDCGITVYPLLQHLRSTSSDATESNEEFLEKLFFSVATKVPRAFNQKNPTSLPWNVMPLIPISNEMQNFRDTKTDHLPKVREKEKYDSVNQYLDTYFTLLREECFFKLKKGIRGFLEGMLDPKDMALYRVSFECVKFVRKPYVGGLSLALKFNDPGKNSPSQNINWESYEYLKCGNLVCLSLDNTFQYPVWACVSENEEIDRGFVSVTLFKDRNMKSDLDVADIICNLEALKERGVKAYMAESQTFYTAFFYAMEVLQEREKVPFQDSMVDGQTPGPAAYITAAEVRPDWSGVFSITEKVPVQEGASQYNLLEDFERMKQDTQPKLDETQLAALEVALKHRLALIQGPPGTGKTHVGLALLQILHYVNVKQNNKLGPILVVTYKNLALNHFLVKCSEMLPPKTNIVRIGRRWEGKLSNCTIQEVADKIKVKKCPTKEICRELEELQMRLLMLSNKLQQVNKFSSTIFREEAEKQHMYSLLIGDGDTSGELSYAEAQRLVDTFNANEPENNIGQLEKHITSSLQKWLPSVDQRDFTEESSPKRPSKSTESDETEAQEDVVGSGMEPSADEKERLEAIGDEDGDDQDVTKKPLNKEACSPVWRWTLPPITNETYAQCKPLLTKVNLWKLTQVERKQFAQVLARRSRDRAKQEFLRVQQEYIAKRDELHLLKRQFDARVLKKCDIVGMTVTGATMRSDILANVKPKIMIVEEAAEVLEAQLLAAIPLSVEHLIMIGDQNQLKPQVHHPRLRKQHHMDLSMFERLANHGLPLVQLGYQCRMREEFADVLNKLELYKDPIKTNEELVAGNDSPKCVTSSMFFQTHTEPEEDSKDSHSKCNKREAVHVAKVAKHFCENGYKMDQITVLCSYRGQVNLIKHDFEHKGLQGIEVTTIDSFQGQEQDIVLISLVRSKGKNIGYLSSQNRICVALSRARCGMYLFGNDLHLALKSRNGWKKIINEMKRRKLTGNKFPFVEPGKQVEIAKRNIGVKENVETTVTKEGTPDLELLRILAKHITKVRKPLGRALGLDDGDVDIIEADNEKNNYEQNYNILKRWKESKGSEATFKDLDNALRHETVMRLDLAQKYCYENKGKPKQIDNTARSGKETKPMQVADDQTELTRATDDTTAPSQVAESETSIGSGPVKNNATSGVGLARENIEHSGTTETENPTSITTVAVQEDDKLPSDRVTVEDHKAVNDPLQESQQPHVKGDPHEEVGDLTDVEKKPRVESGSS